MFWKKIYDANAENTSEEYLTSFAVKRDMFHAFFGTLGGSNMNIEYNHPRSTLLNFQTAQTSTQQIIPSQNVEVGMTQTLQITPMIESEQSASAVPQSQIETVSTVEIILQPILTTSHVPESRVDIATQPQDSELSSIVLSSQIDQMQDTSVVSKADEILTRAQAIAKYQA